MRLISFRDEQGPRFGAVVGDEVVDISRAAGGEWGDLREALTNGSLPSLKAAADRSTRRLRPDAVEFLPVVPNPDKIICVGLNYRGHGQEANLQIPDRPSLFVRFPASQVGHKQDIIRPFLSDQFDFEGELAVVIGRRARHIREADAFTYVAGYACFGEHSIRDWQMHSRQATPGKNFHASGAFGPWLVTADEVRDPAALALVTRVNGVEMQRDTTANMVFSIPYLIAYISTFAELLPGDVIATGTPAGVGFTRKPPLYLKSGDLVEVEIAGLGILQNRVVDEPHPSQKSG